MFDNYAVTVMIGGEPYTLGLFDTAGKLAWILCGGGGGGDRGGMCVVVAGVCVCSGGRSVCV